MTHLISKGKVTYKRSKMTSTLSSYILTFSWDKLIAVAFANNAYISEAMDKKLFVFQTILKF